MPYYSELGLYSGSSSSSYLPLFLTGPYSNHSSILANNFTRPHPTYIKSPRSYRNYKPHLSTISERRTDSPLRKINSSNVSYSTPFIIPKPITINTADIDVSVNKYRKYERQRNKPDGISELKQEKKSPSPSRSTESPRSSTEMKEAVPTSNIKRERATVRLKTIHKDKVMTQANYRKWRENFDADELYPEEVESPKSSKKSPGEILKEKFLIPSEAQDDSSDPEKGKTDRKKGVKTSEGIVKTPSFHDICTAITSENIDKELNPGQPIEVQRRQSRQFPAEVILKENRRTSVELSDSERNVIDTILNQVENERAAKDFNSRGSVKKKRKYSKNHSSSLNLDSVTEDLSKQPTHRKPSLKNNSRSGSSNSKIENDVSEPSEKKYMKNSLKDDVEAQSKIKPVMKASKQIKEKPILKAIVDDIMIEETISPKLKKGGKLKFNFTVEEIKHNSCQNYEPAVPHKESPTTSINKNCETESVSPFETTNCLIRDESIIGGDTPLSKYKSREPNICTSESSSNERTLNSSQAKLKLDTQKSESIKVEVPKHKKPIVSNVIKKKHSARMGLILEEIKETPSEERSSSQNKSAKKVLLENDQNEANKNHMYKEMNAQKNTEKTELKSAKDVASSDVKSHSAESVSKPKASQKITDSNENTLNSKKPEMDNNIKKCESSEDFWKLIGPRESIRPTVQKIGHSFERVDLKSKADELNTTITCNESETKEVETVFEDDHKRHSGDINNNVYRENCKDNQISSPMTQVNQTIIEENLSEATIKKLISKRSLIQKPLKDDPDLVVFDPPPETETIETGPKEGDKKEVFVPLQSNRLSHWMHPFKKPEQFEECPVEIYARPKTIRKRHLPRGRFGQWERCEQSSSDEDSNSSSDSEEDSTSREEEVGQNGRVGVNYGASTSSNDSGFDSGAAKNKDKGSTSDTRDFSSASPASNPAFFIDPNEEECCKSSTYQGFQKSGRITPPATTIPRFRKYCVEDFHFLKVLGKGSFGKVLLAELKETEYYYAIKCLKKDVVLEDDDVECTLIERKVLALGTKHPYLCHLLCTFQTESHLFFVMEYLNGGDLMFHIQQSGRFSEDRARFYAAEIVSGLKFLHNKGIVYRDLKLDNILLDFDGHVRIADFGMCKLQVFLDRMADTFCGTPDYMAPEIIKGQHYNQSVDWWSFGVLLYEMLLAQSPFSGCDEDELFWSICNEKPVLPRFLSQESSRILSMLLDKDASKRLGTRFSPCGDIKDQPFFKSINWDQLEARLLEPPFKPNLSHPLDTKYFDKHFTTEVAKLTPIEHHILESMDQTQFQGFSYTNPNATDK